MGENFKSSGLNGQKRNTSQRKREREGVIKEWRQLFSGSEELASQGLLNHTFFAIPKLVRLTFDVGQGTGALNNLSYTRNDWSLFCRWLSSNTANQSKTKPNQKRTETKLLVNKNNHICPIPLSLSTSPLQNRRNCNILQYRDIDRSRHLWIGLGQCIDPYCPRSVKVSHPSREPSDLIGTSIFFLFLSCSFFFRS